MNLRDFIATTPEPNLPVVPFVCTPQPLTPHDVALRDLWRDGALVRIGSSRAGFREYRVTEDLAYPDPTKVSFLLLAMPLRWEGDDS